MAILPGYKATAVDGAGNVLGSTSVEVRLASNNALAAIYSDINGLSSLANPFNADANGDFEFYADAEYYIITLGSGTSPQQFPFVLGEAEQVVPTTGVFTGDGVIYSFVISGVYTQANQIDLYVGGIHQDDSLYGIAAGATTTTVTMAGNLPFPDGQIVAWKALQPIDTVAVTGDFPIMATSFSDLQSRMAGGLALTDGEQILVGQGDASLIYEWSTGATALTSVDANLANLIPVAPIAPQHWGYVAGAPGTGATYSSANDTALQAAIDYTKNNSLSLVFPAGDYGVDTEMNCWRSGSSRLDGHAFICDEKNTTFYPGPSLGNADTMFKFTDPAGAQTNQNKNLLIRGMRFGRDTPDDYSSSCPVAIDTTWQDDADIRGLHFGKWNNTVWRTAKNANAQFSDIYSFGAGRWFQRQDTSGFTVTCADGVTVTASSGTPFSTDWVGKNVVITGGGLGRKRNATVASRTSGSEIVLNESGSNFTNATILIEQPRLSRDGTNTDRFNSDVSCFASTDVGLAIVVEDGAAAGRPKWFKITAYNSATQVTVDETIPYAVADAKFYVPAFDHNDVYNTGVGATDMTNHFRMRDVTFSHAAGLSMWLGNMVRADITGIKVHGDSSYAQDHMSGAGIWVDEFEGRIGYIAHSNFLEQEVVRVFQTQSVGSTVRQEGTLVLGEHQAGLKLESNCAPVGIGDLRSNGDDLATVIDDQSGTAQPGPVLVGNNLPAAENGEGLIPSTGRTLAGHTLVHGANGLTVNGNSLEIKTGTWTPILTDGVNDATAGTSYGHYRRVGDQVTVTMQLKNITPGSVSGGLFIKGLPYASKSTADMEWVAAIRVSQLTFTNPPVAVLENGEVEFKLFEAASGASGAQVVDTQLDGANRTDFTLTLVYETDDAF